MARYEHLSIYREAFDLVVYFEKIVRNFSRYNKYTHGTALREQSSRILSTIIRANNLEDKLAELELLALQIEELKVRIRVCREVRVFHNSNSYKISTNHVISIARQNAGWIRSLSVKKKERSESTILASNGICR